MPKMTPMLQQYLQIKQQYPDCILFYRMGDFYEMFFEDAEKASKALEIVLTSRSKGLNESVPLCGVPYHSADAYLARLLEQGFKVAICEQVEDPEKAKGIVRRSVTRVVTPGTSLGPQNLPAKGNRYLLALARHGRQSFGLAFLDFSTGEFRASQFERLDELLDEVARLDPAEVLLARSLLEEPDFAPRFNLYLADREEAAVNHPPEFAFEREEAERALREHFRVENLEGFGLTGYPAAVSAAGGLLRYLQDTQAAAGEAPFAEHGGAEPISLPHPLAHITDLTYYTSRDYLALDETTKRNLELVRTLRDNKTQGSLFSLLDHTVTPMGGRLLLSWLTHPLLELAAIAARLDAVEFATADHAFRLDLRDLLARLADLERLAGRISTQSANARDLLAGRETLKLVPKIQGRLRELEPALFSEIRDRLAPLPELVGLLDRGLNDEPPAALREGGLIKPGFNAELDELTLIQKDGKAWIARLEATEKKRTGIGSLKVRYNQVFGYYLEVTKAHLKSVPADYLRKQTLVNAERFITPELKEMEAKVLGAEERIQKLHYELFCGLRERAAAETERLQADARELARLDAILALAELAARKDYVRPEVNEGEAIEIKAGRHPVIEELFKKERFIPNDIYLDCADHQVLIITGPNMAGKSTVLRQTALIVLLAQMGSFVPADAARIGVCDRIFTRVGAADILSKGMSTFMVEMTETANILRYATRKSLILLDEIGRGTSTFDGLSIAWAVAEYLHDHPDKRAKTMFATHYHELVDLAETKPRVKNYNIAVKEWNGQVIFLRKLQPGGTSRSYGIEVARLAGLPPELIQRAKEILANLEAQEHDPAGKPTLAQSRDRSTREEAAQISFLEPPRDPAIEEVLSEIRSLNLNSMTPLEALTLLDRLRKKILK